jgi:hypothetical protein
MENKQKQYEKPDVEISYVGNQDVLTQSQESGRGDGWVKDPFVED